MSKLYLSAPLPFVGQKRMFARHFMEVIRQYPEGTVFVDPPYLSTDVGTYRMYWRLADYLDVLSVLPGHDFVYFTSEKSCITELCEWMGRHPSLGDPFARCQRREFNATVNYSARYTDIMLFTIPGLPPGNAA